MAGAGSVLNVWDLRRVTGRGSATAEEVTAVALVDSAPQPLAVVATRGTLSGWDVVAGERRWQHTDAGAFDLAAVPGRRAVVAARCDGAVTLLEADSGDQVVLGTEPGGAPGNAVAVSDDGRWAVTAHHGAISIWGLDARRLRHRITPTAHVVKAVALTPPPSVIVSLADRGAYDDNSRRRLMAAARARRAWETRRRAARSRTRAGPGGFTAMSCYDGCAT